MSILLSKQEKQQIQSEEVAAAQVTLARRREQKRREARWTYRREVRATLNPRARLGVAALLMVLLLAGVVAALLGRADEGPDDTSGGIADSALMARCQDALRMHVGAAEPPCVTFDVTPRFRVYER